MIESQRTNPPAAQPPAPSRHTLQIQAASFHGANSFGTITIASDDARHYGSVGLPADETAWEEAI